MEGRRDRRTAAWCRRDQTDAWDTLKKGGTATLVLEITCAASALPAQTDLAILGNRMSCIGMRLLLSCVV